MKRAVVLVSGGLDSATTLAVAAHEGFEVYALSFLYGQRHRTEVEAARKVVAAQGAREHRVAEIDLRVFGGSALTGDWPVPKREPLGRPGIPPTYIPARNTIFLSYALAYAEVSGARHIFIGVNAVDYSGYPDCRPEFIAAFENVARLGTEAGVTGASLQIRAPLIDLTKAEIIRRGLELGVDYSITLSCYDPAPDSRACGECDSCQLRRAGFREAGVEDPIAYVR